MIPENINIHVYHHADPQMAYVIRLLEATYKKEAKDMAALDDQITQLAQKVAANTSGINSAETTISGLAKLLADAIASAANGGATDAQLAQLQSLQATLDTDDAGLAAAIVAGTSAAPTAPTT